MDLIEMICAVTDNNHGAENAIGNLILTKNDIDSKAFGQSLFPVVICEENGYVGSVLHGLYVDLCQRNAVNVYTLFRAQQVGIVTKELILENIVEARRNNLEKWIEDISQLVDNKLPNIINRNFQHVHQSGRDVLFEGMVKIGDEMEEFEKSRKPSEQTTTTIVTLHQEHPAGTTHEIAIKLGISKKQVRHAKSNGTLDELLRKHEEESLV